MIIKNVFGFTIFKFHCENPDFYQNKALVNSVERMLELPWVKDRIQGDKYDSAYGNVLTTVSNDYSDLTITPGMEKLLAWVNEQLLKTNQDATSVQYTRTWMNKMFKNSEGLVHAHVHPDFNENNLDFVAIFYLASTEDSANLTFIKEGKFNTHYYDYPVDRRISIPCTPGDMIVHAPHAYHSVTKHIHDDPRVCFVFEGHFNG